MGAEPVMFLVPVWLDPAGGPELLPAANTAIVKGLTCFFVENERSARRALLRMAPDLVINDLHLHRLDRDTAGPELLELLALARAAGRSAILSEAGMPCIADPGAGLVALAHREGFRVVPLAGPSSLLLALAASGLQGQHFTFHGYLPRDPKGRREALLRLERDVERTGATQVFIETPYRNRVLLDEILRTCSPRTVLCIAAGIGGDRERIVTQEVATWRGTAIDLDDVPAVFLLGQRALPAPLRGGRRGR